MFLSRAIESTMRISSGLAMKILCYLVFCQPRPVVAALHQNHATNGRGFTIEDPNKLGRLFGQPTLRLEPVSTPTPSPGGDKFPPAEGRDCPDRSVSFGEDGPMLMHYLCNRMGRLFLA